MWYNYLNSAVHFFKKIIQTYMMMFYVNSQHLAEGFDINGTAQ